MLRMTNVTGYRLEIYIQIKMFPNVGRIKNVSSKCLPAIKNRNKACFRTSRMLPLIIWISKSGAGNPIMRALGLANGMCRSLVSDMALWMTPVCSRACF